MQNLHTTREFAGRSACLPVQKVPEKSADSTLKSSRSNKKEGWDKQRKGLGNCVLFFFRRVGLLFLCTSEHFFVEYVCKGCQSAMIGILIASIFSTLWRLIGSLEAPQLFCQCDKGVLFYLNLPHKGVLEMAWKVPLRLKRWTCYNRSPDDQQSLMFSLSFPSVM